MQLTVDNRGGIHPLFYVFWIHWFLSIFSNFHLPGHWLFIGFPKFPKRFPDHENILHILRFPWPMWTLMYQSKYGSKKIQGGGGNILQIWLNFFKIQRVSCADMCFHSSIPGVQMPVCSPAIQKIKVKQKVKTQQHRIADSQSLPSRGVRIKNGLTLPLYRQYDYDYM